MDSPVVSTGGATSNMTLPFKIAQVAGDRFIAAPGLNDFKNSHTHPSAVWILIGDQGSGKSQVATGYSRCAGSNMCWPVGNTHDHTTHGLDAYCLNNIILMEIEGLGSLVNDQEHDLRKINLVATAHGLIYVAKGTIQRSHVEHVAALLEVWNDRRLQLAPDAERQLPHLMIVLRTDRDGPLLNFQSNFQSRVSHLCASIAVTIVKEVAGAERVHLTRGEPERVPQFMNDMRTVHEKVAEATATIKRSSLFTPHEIADIVTKTLGFMYENPGFRPADLRHQIVMARFGQWQNAQRQQFIQNCRPLVEDPYSVADASVEIRRFEESWAAAFDQNWARLYGSKADSSLLEQLRQAHSEVMSLQVANSRRDILASQNRQQDEITTARAGGFTQLSATFAALKLTGASRDQVDGPMRQALTSAQVQFDQATRTLRHPSKSAARAALETEHARLVQLAHANNQIQFEQEKQRLAKTAAAQRTLTLPASGYLGTGNNTFHYSWNLAQLAPDFFGPGKMELLISGYATIVPHIENADLARGGPMILQRTAGAQTLFSGHEGDRKWHNYSANWASATATISASVGSGGWGKVAGNLRKWFSQGSVQVTPSALFENPTFNRANY